MNNPLSFFAGRDGFNWFIGVCEDRDDPKSMGRVRVRCFGVHTEDLVQIPTQDLPWAQVVLPPTSKPGEIPNITPGQWVFGFFRDPDFLQEPIILGVLPGHPMYSANPKTGFNDPNSVDAVDSQDTKYKKAPDFGPYPVLTKQADTSRLASGKLEAHPEIAARDEAYTKDVLIANDEQDDPNKWSELRTTDDSTRGKTAEGTNPETNETREEKKRRGTEYPYNHVIETESGHIKEYDDTPYAERIYEKHRTGTFYEIDADGNKVTRIVGNSYEIVAGTEYVNVKGDVNLTVDSNCNTYIKGNWNIQVDGDVKEVIKGKLTQTVTGSVSETYEDTKTENVTGAVSETYKANQTTNITGTLDLDASSEVDIDAGVINLN